MSTPRRRPGADPGPLQSPGWNDHTRSALNTLIRRGAGKGLPVVFDFDNTIVCGDIGEATLAVLARSGVLTPKRLAHLTQPFSVPGKGQVAMDSLDDITQYYEALLSPTAHGSSDPTPMASGYVWATETLENLTVLDVVNATCTAFQWPQPTSPAFIEVTPGKTKYPVPFFYPQMIELIAELVRHEFDVWVVSASNVWSVRCMVLRALNPLLRARGITKGLSADHVIGISTLLVDDAGSLYKDPLLVRENPAYGSLDEKALAKFRVTNRLHFPVPTYSGKVACILDALGRNPYLCVGDSPGDHPMMAVSQHRLWIARLEKSAYQRRLETFIQHTGPSGWLFQPTFTATNPGFTPHSPESLRSSDQVPISVRESAQILTGLLRIRRSRKPSRSPSRKML